MMTGPCVSRCESLTALPRASGRAKSGACAPSLRAFSAAPEFMSCPIGLSKSCSRFVGNQLAPSAINSSICCCNGVFVGTVITMIVHLPKRTFGSLYKERGSRGQVCDRHVSVTNLPPRPSLFVQATESTFWKVNDHGDDCPNEHPITATD